jgi:hypothetical protein
MNVIFLNSFFEIALKFSNVISEQTGRAQSNNAKHPIAFEKHSQTLIMKLFKKITLQRFFIFSYASNNMHQKLILSPSNHFALHIWSHRVLEEDLPCAPL